MNGSLHRNFILNPLETVCSFKTQKNNNIVLDCRVTILLVPTTSVGLLHTMASPEFRAKMHGNTAHGFVMVKSSRSENLYKIFTKFM